MNESKELYYSVVGYKTEESEGKYLCEDVSLGNAYKCAYDYLGRGEIQIAKIMIDGESMIDTLAITQCKYGIVYRDEDNHIHNIAGHITARMTTLNIVKTLNKYQFGQGQYQFAVWNYYLRIWQIVIV